MKIIGHENRDSNLESPCISGWNIVPWKLKHFVNTDEI
jgi:hypothetical protein